MGKCIVPSCNMHTDRDSGGGVRFFPIPAIRHMGTPLYRTKSVLRRRAWLYIINNEDLLDEYEKTTRRICSRHFISGQPAAPKDELNSDWLPSLHLEDGREHISHRTYGKKRRTTPNQNPAQLEHSTVADTTLPTLRQDPLETSSTIIQAEIKTEPLDLEDNSPQLDMEDHDINNRPSPPTENDIVIVRCDEYNRREEELQSLRNENAELIKSYTKLRNQLTEADVDKLELNAELSEVKKKNAELSARNHALLDENIFLTNKIISCESLAKTLKDEAKTHVNKIASLDYSLNNVKRVSLRIEHLQEDDDYVLYYTGLPCHQTFEMILNHVRSRVNEPRCVLAPWQCFLLTLMRLKIASQQRDLAYRFGVSRPTVCAVSERWLDHLYQSLDSFIVWHQRDIIKRTMTDSFKEAFGDNIVMILYCLELFPEKISQSNAKNSNSVKYFIGMIPSGAISFVSRGWETRGEAVRVLAESELYKCLKSGDEIISDYSLPKCESLGWCCAKVLDTTERGEILFSCQGIAEPRRRSMLRGQIEKIKALRRKYRLLKGQISMQDTYTNRGYVVSQIDKVVRVCCALSNISESNM